MENMSPRKPEHLRDEQVKRYKEKSEVIKETEFIILNYLRKVRKLILRPILIDG